MALHEEQQDQGQEAFFGRTEKTLETGITVRRTKAVCGY